MSVSVLREDVVKGAVLTAFEDSGSKRACFSSLELKACECVDGDKHAKFRSALFRQGCTDGSVVLSTVLVSMAHEL